MFVKLMRADGKEEIFPCAHISKTTYTEESSTVKSGLDTPGIRVELSPKGPMLRLPEDGDTIYLMNEEGDTIDTLRWPLPARRRARAEGAR